MDIDFGLTAGGHTVEQHHVFLFPLCLYVVHGLGLGVVERLHVFGMRLSGMVEPSHLTVVGFEEAVHDELAHDGRRAARGIHEFLACQFFDLTRSLEVDIPVRELEESEKYLLLSWHAPQQIDGDMQCLFVAVFGGQPHAGLCLGAVARLGFQSGGQGSVHHFSHRAHIVRCDPLPQPVLRGQDHG